MTKAPLTWEQGTRVLLVGGGSSHDFNRFFNQSDSAMLKESGRFAVNYTEDAEVAARELRLFERLSDPAG